MAESTALKDLYIGKTYHILVKQPASVTTPYVFTGKEIHLKISATRDGAATISRDSTNHAADFVISTDANSNEQVDIYVRVTETAMLSVGSYYVQVHTDYNAGADEDMIVEPTFVRAKQGIT